MSGEEIERGTGVLEYYSALLYSTLFYSILLSSAVQCPNYYTLLYVSTQTDLYEMFLVIRDDRLPIVKIEGEIDLFHRPERG